MASKLLKVGAPGRVELPTNGLGNRCSIHLSYGARETMSLSHAKFALFRNAGIKGS